MTQLSTTTQQTIPTIAPIDPTSLTEHGESPTSIILAIAILISILLGAVTGLVRVVAILILRQAKSSH
jgi:hypothetical protein